MKPHVVFADTEKNYIFPLAYKLLETYGKELYFELFSDKDSFYSYIGSHSKIDLLVVDEDFIIEPMESYLNKIKLQVVLNNDNGIHNENTEGRTALYKYSAMNVLYGVLSSHCDKLCKKKDPTINDRVHAIMVTSMYGGAGKSLVAYSLTRVLSNIGQKALYMDVEWNQNADGYLDSASRLGVIDGQKLFRKSENRISEILGMVKNIEGINYIPNINSPIISMNKNPEQLVDLIDDLKRDGNYKYIIIDTDSSCDNCKMKLMEICTDYVFVIDSSKSAYEKMNQFFENFIVQDDNCYFIFNKAAESTPSSIKLAYGKEIHFSAKIPLLSVSDPDKVRQLSRKSDFQALCYLIN